VDQSELILLPPDFLRPYASPLSCRRRLCRCVRPCGTRSSSSSTRRRSSAQTPWRSTLWAAPPS
jgi:hypothetical protein